MAQPTPKIGILAIQGDYEAHAAVLNRLGVAHTLVRWPRDLESLDGVILPGGESTTMLKFLGEEGLDRALVDFAARGRAIFGTCAGTILLAREVKNPPQRSLGLIDRFPSYCATDTAASLQATSPRAHKASQRTTRNGFHSRTDYRIDRPRKWKFWRKMPVCRCSCAKARSSPQRFIPN
jgi:putative intracellular protease/amidase